MKHDSHDYLDSEQIQEITIPNSALPRKNGAGLSKTACRQVTECYNKADLKEQN